MKGLFSNQDGSPNFRNIAGVIFMVASIAMAFVIIFKGITNWYELVFPLGFGALSLIVFDFITLKNISDTYKALKKPNEPAQGGDGGK